MPSPRYAIACLLVLQVVLGSVPSAVAAVSAVLDKDEAAVIANEPPQIRELLVKAIQFERNERDWQGDWKAAGLYCEASRLGRAEAQYRMGMLYAFGKGAPQDVGAGESLFWEGMGR